MLIYFVYLYLVSAHCMQCQEICRSSFGDLIAQPQRHGCAWSSSNLCPPWGISCREEHSPMMSNSWSLLESALSPWLPDHTTDRILCLTCPWGRVDQSIWHKQTRFNSRIWIFTNEKGNEMWKKNIKVEWSLTSHDPLERGGEQGTLTLGYWINRMPSLLGNGQ